MQKVKKFNGSGDLDGYGGAHFLAMLLFTLFIFIETIKNKLYFNLFKDQHHALLVGCNVSILRFFKSKEKTWKAINIESNKQKHSCLI